MTEKRFQVYKVIGSFHEWSIEDSFDDKVVFGSIMHKYNADRLCAKLNELAEENKSFKNKLEFFYELNKPYGVIIEENKKLKQSIKEVLKLLEEEVDLFSDKATEHDINAYIELRELDNKDAYYMVISTKKAIKLLKEMMK